MASFLEVASKTLNLLLSFFAFFSPSFTDSQYRDAACPAGRLQHWPFAQEP